MTIGIDVRSVLEPRLTGVGTYVHGVLTGMADLCERHTSVERYRLWGSGRTMPDSSRLPHNRCFSYRHIDLPNKLLNLAWRGIGHPRLTRYVPGSDCYWFPNIAFVPRRLSIPYVLTVHDLSFEHYPYWFSLKRRLWHSMVGVHALIRGAAALVAVSDATAHAIVEVFGAECARKIRVIPPAIHPSTSTPEQPSAIPIDSDYILYIGTIEPRKNIEAVLAAHRLIRRSFPNVRLILVGQYGWSMRHGVKEIMLSPGVTWRDYISDEEKSELIQSARVLVWPSYYEGFGFPPFEALRSGIPVITSHRTSLPEMLGRHVLYVQPYSVGELAQVMAQVLSSPQLPSFLRQIPRRFNERTWTLVATDYIELFGHYAHRH